MYTGVACDWLGFLVGVSSGGGCDWQVDVVTSVSTPPPVMTANDHLCGHLTRCATMCTFILAPHGRVYLLAVERADAQIAQRHLTYPTSLSLSANNEQVNKE